MSKSLSVTDKQGSRMDHALDRLGSAFSALEASINRLSDRTAPVRIIGEPECTSTPKPPRQESGPVIARLDDLCDALNEQRGRIDDLIDLFDI